ncbi:fimbrial protein [Bacteroides sp. 224]|uniref:fimbrial tip adhesin FimD n=1 Tax=Bacteroides sp. 224 TaxID=2302936 RepID=UPI0013D4A45C|nr:fimbrial protein [Bacteroides sp. 224]NDV66882.1 hypothetical protein [Bacteroides sp. 224]
MKNIYLISFCLVLTLFGCGNEEVISVDDVKGQTVVFSLINKDHDAAMRSTTSGEESLNENLINRLDVFFFNEWEQCLYYPSETQMVKEGTMVKINVPEDVIDVLLGENLKLYVVANCHLERNVLEGKTYKQLIETTHGVSTDFNPYPFVAQTDFLMDGVLLVNNLTEDRTNLGEVTLNRAASKIKVQITGATIDGYTPVEAFVRINNYLESTTLGGEAPLYVPQKSDYKNSAYRSISLPGGTQVDTAPFYSYANNWEYGDLKESYITIRVKWYKNGGGAEPKDYYYRLPFSHILSGEDRYALKRNHTYTFKVNIAALGGLDSDEMIELTPDFVIKEWSTNRIVAKLNQYDYLVVSETNVEMHDVNTRSIQYISSQPVSVDIQEVYHFTYLSLGDIQTNKILPGDARYPKIEADETTNKISITSPVPINYVPVMMRFRVKNTKGLYQDVYVIQYPRQYITSRFSNKSDIKWAWYDVNWESFWSNYGDGGVGMQNFNLYTVTTTSVNSGDAFIVGGNMRHNEYNLTMEEVLNVTNKDAETNNMISPQFVIASQRGITSTKTSYSAAQVRCAYYMEGTFDRGTWRMPTVAEMLLISKLQMDGNSAIKGLFTPGNSVVDGSDRWWAARQDVINGVDYYYSVRVTTGELVRQAYSPGNNYASVRCVRDVWKN